MRGLEDGKTTSKNQEMTGDKPWKKSKNIQDKKGLEGMPGSRNTPAVAQGQRGPGMFQKQEKVNPATAVILRMLGGTTGVQQAGTDIGSRRLDQITECVEYPAKGTGQSRPPQAEPSIAGWV